MSIGSVLLQPQRIRRAAPANSDAALIEDVLRTATRLLLDPEEAGHIFTLMGEAIQTTAHGFQKRVAGRLTGAHTRLQVLLKPVLDFFQGFDADAAGGGPAEGMQLAEQMLVALSDALRGLGLDDIRGYLAELFDILENQLGVDGSFIEAETWGFVDAVIAGLEGGTVGTTPEARENRLETAAVLRRAKRRLQQQFQFPQFDVEKLSRLLLDRMRRSGLAAVAEKAACAADTLDAVTEATARVNALVRAIQLGSAGAAAADGAYDGPPYGWYATWLLQYKYRDLPLFTPDELKDARALAAKLKQTPSGDRVAAWLGSRLTTDERSALDAWDGAASPDEALRQVLVGLLNRLVQTAILAEEPAFSAVSLGAETRDLAKDYEDDQQALRYNRMVLEDVLPGELQKMPRTRGERFWAWLGEGIRAGVGWPGEQVRISSDGRYVFLGDKIMHSGLNVRWQDAPLFAPPSRIQGHPYYRFQHISADFMEGWAWHSTWANDAVRSVWHLLNTRKTGRAHFVPSLLNGLYDVSHGLTSGLARRPFAGFTFFSHKWLEWLLGAPLALTTAGSAQGAHTDASFVNRLAFWFTVYAGDIMNLAGPVTATDKLRNLTLAFMTALNFRGPQDGPSTVARNSALNYKELEAIVDAVATGFAYWLASEVRREEYVHPFFPGDVPGRVWALWLAGGAGMGLFAGFVGTLIAAITAWAEDWELLGWTMLKSMPKVILPFWVILYSLREGDTDDGKFNPLGGAAFAGYPAKRSGGSDTPSPYRLPYAAGEMINVGQGNQGVFSHNPIANGINRPPADQATMQTYAYDFAHDQAEEILASRPGTVHSLFQNTTDDTTGAWNFIIIRHDVDDDGNPIAPDPVHDRTVGGALTRTFAVYGHGRQNGVTDAFALWDTPPATIARTTVKRGQPIMLAGDTGTSFYNHLHMHVLPGDSGPASIDPDDSVAIPFVFQDVDDDGVCKAMNWYESANQRRTS
jgi:hypothetical protein